MLIGTKWLIDIKNADERLIVTICKHTHPHLLPKILTALEKHRDADNVRVNTVKTLMKKLSVIASEKRLFSRGM
jgi:hypothetical protein